MSVHNLLPAHTERRDVCTLTLTLPLTSRVRDLVANHGWRPVLSARVASLATAWDGAADRPLLLVGERGRRLVCFGVGFISTTPFVRLVTSVR